MSHRCYKTTNKTENIYIAHLQGAILCYVFFYVLCFVFCFFHLQLILAITKDVNTKTYNTRRFIVKSQFNRSIPLSCKWIKVKRKKKSKVMCNACYIFFMCAPSHMCMQIHIQKCPVTLIVSPVPRVVCKEMDAYPSCSHASHE